MTHICICANVHIYINKCAFTTRWTDICKHTPIYCFFSLNVKCKILKQLGFIFCVDQVLMCYNYFNLVKEIHAERRGENNSCQLSRIETVQKSSELLRCLVQGFLYYFIYFSRIAVGFHSEGWPSSPFSIVRGFSFPLPPNSLLVHSL